MEGVIGKNNAVTLHHSQSMSDFLDKGGIHI